MMNSLLQTPIDPTPLTRYTAQMVASDGSVLVSAGLLAADDRDALAQARSVAKRFAVDLWVGSRFIGHIQPG